MRPLFDITVLNCKEVVLSGRYVADTRTKAEKKAFEDVVKKDPKFAREQRLNLTYNTSLIGWVSCNVRPVAAYPCY